MEQEHNPFREH
jgi:hypothetical protein